MTPPAPNDPQGAVPQRHRSNADNLASDTSERGFWDLDESADAAPSAVPGVTPAEAAPAALEPARGFTGGAEMPTRNAVPQARVSASVERFKSAREITGNLDALQPAKPTFMPSGVKPMEKAFDELENWEEAQPTPPPPSAPLVEDIFEGFTATPDDEHPAPTPAASTPTTPPPAATTDDTAARTAALKAGVGDDSEFAANPTPTEAKPWAFRPRIKLNPLEIVGVVALFIVLAAGGIWVYSQTLHRLSRSNPVNSAVEFPVTGKHVTLTGVTTYWRAPATVGEARRGVALVPVAEITVSGGPGAIRVFFHNEHGKKTGDPATRTVQGPTTLTVVGTDGFDDVSMHAAYRTDPTKPWFIQIYEAPSENSAGADFQPLAKVPVSPSMR